MAKAEETPDPTSFDRLAAALERISERQVTAPSDQNTELMLRLTAALERLSEAQLAGSKLIADETKRSHRPSNEVVHGRSVFNRRGANLPDDAEGLRKVPLKCLMLLPWLAEWESLTREEVDLLNLLEPGEYVIKRADDSQVKVVVTTEYKVDGTPSRLILTHETAFNNDNFKMMVPLHNMLRQLLNQHSPEIASAAARTLTDDEEGALIAAGKLTVAA